MSQSLGFGSCREAYHQACGCFAKADKGSWSGKAAAAYNHRYQELDRRLLMLGGLLERLETAQTRLEAYL